MSRVGNFTGHHGEGRGLPCDCQRPRPPGHATHGWAACGGGSSAGGACRPGAVLIMQHLCILLYVHCGVTRVHSLLGGGSSDGGRSRAAGARGGPSRCARTITLGASPANRHATTCSPEQQQKGMQCLGRLPAQGALAMRKCNAAMTNHVAPIAECVTAHISAAFQRQAQKRQGAEQPSRQLAPPFLCLPSSHHHAARRFGPG